MPKKILIVEDENGLADDLRQAFMDANFTVSVAQDGKEGLNAAIAEKPDIILLDILMPVMGGLEMLRELRKDSWGKSVPIIMLTVVTDEAVVAESVKNFAFDYLIKTNYTLEQIVEKVKKKIGIV